MKTTMSVLIAVLALATTAYGAEEITIYPHVSPNPSRSAFFSLARANAMQGMEVGGRSVGTGPSAFVALATNAVGTSGMITLTSFHSWLGSPNPEPLYADEYGNQLFFGVVLKSAGRLRLSDISWVIEGSDSQNLLGSVGSFSTNTYSISRVGVDYGPDRVKGTADDIRRTSGAGTLLVDEIILFGVGRAFSISAVSALLDVDEWVVNNQPFSLKCTFRSLTGTGTLTAERTVKFFADTPPVVTGEVRLSIERTSAQRATVWVYGPPGNYNVSWSATPGGVYGASVALRKGTADRMPVDVPTYTPMQFFKAMRTGD